MTPSMQVDNQKIVVYSNLEDSTKLSTVSFLLDAGDIPFVQFTAGNSNSAIRLTNVAAPTGLADVTNKEYVDAVARGLTVKSPVRLLAVTNYDTLVPGGVVDGTEVREGDRVLLIGQTNAVQNGIYVVTASGMVRSDDLVAGSFGTGVYVFVDEGNTYMDRS